MCQPMHKVTCYEVGEDTTRGWGNGVNKGVGGPGVRVLVTAGGVTRGGVIGVLGEWVVGILG